MNAAIKCLSNYHNRKIAVLGDMKELGACEIKLHTDLVEICIQNNIDRVYTVGALMKKLHEALPDEIRGVHADNSQELSDVIVDEIKEGDAILIKGSFSMNMNYIVQRIIKSL